MAEINRKLNIEIKKISIFFEIRLYLVKINRYKLKVDMHFTRPLVSGQARSITSVGDGTFLLQ